MDKLQVVSTLLRTHEFDRALDVCDAFLATVTDGTAVAPAWYAYRGIASYFKSRFADAARNYQEALRLNPDHLSSNTNLAHIYACCPDDSLHDAAEAIRLSQHACNLTRRELWFAVQSLTASYLRAHNFDAARRNAEVSMSLATSAQRYRVVELIDCIAQKRPFTATVESDLAKLKTDFIRNNAIEP